MSLANPTLEYIWKLFQETDRKFLQMQEESKKLDEKLTEKIEKVNS